MPLSSNYSGHILEAGCDEAGRGCLAGPVVAAAVILDRDHIHPELNDSKQISPMKRRMLASWIEKNASATAVGLCTSMEIDKMNILNASIEAMHRALEDLDPTPEFILVDGNKFKTFRSIPHRCIVKGDSKYASIAAASILAKYYRDSVMQELHSTYPQFHWKNNKGYPTRHHRTTLISSGPSPYHRTTFRLKEMQLSIFPVE